MNARPEMHVSTAFNILGLNMNSLLQQEAQVMQSEADVEKVEKAVKDICKKKFHELAIELHPDKNKGTEDQFKKITNAYNLIKKHFKVSIRRPEPVHRIVINDYGMDNWGFSMSSTNATTAGFNFTDIFS